MVNLYIIDIYSLSVSTGIVTYLNNIVQFASDLNSFKISIIELDANESCFCIHKIRNIDYMMLPSSLGNDYNIQHAQISSLLKTHIQDADNNIFMLNYLPCNLLLKSLRKAFVLSKFIITIHDMSWSSPLLGDSIQLKKIIKNKNYNGDYPHLINSFNQEQESFRLADKIVCLSDDTCDLLNDCYGLATEKIELISNGIMAKRRISLKIKENLRKKLFIGPHEKIILMVGRMSRAKGTYAYLKAFETIVSKNANAKLVIVGSIYNPAQLLEACKSFVSKVIFTGRLYADELALWYKIADIGVIPSYTEQCSYVGLEMMSYGLPIVASDGFGVRCMFHNDFNATVVSIGSRKKSKIYEQNLASSTLKLIDNSSLKEKISKKATQLLTKEYSLSMMQEKYKKLWKSSKLFSFLNFPQQYNRKGYIVETFPA